MSQIAEIDPDASPSGPGCAECLASADGWWFHLRRCAACGHIGCCDSSPSQHASAHARGTGHPVIQSFEPGEDWYWRYDSNTYLDGGPTLCEPTSHPLDQPTPAPVDRLPADWEQHLH
jgi:hypothetical protein